MLKKTYNQHVLFFRQVLKLCMQYSWLTAHCSDNYSHADLTRSLLTQLDPAPYIAPIFCTLLLGLLGAEHTFSAWIEPDERAAATQSVLLEVTSQRIRVRESEDESGQNWLTLLP